ncbi:MAG: Transcription initiation factor TFIID subunit 6 [Marteilia pararefringens]
MIASSSSHHSKSSNAPLNVAGGSAAPSYYAAAAPHDHSSSSSQAQRMQQQSVPGAAASAHQQSLNLSLNVAKRLIDEFSAQQYAANKTTQQQQQQQQQSEAADGGVIEASAANSNAAATDGASTHQCADSGPPGTAGSSSNAAGDSQDAKQSSLASAAATTAAAAAASTNADTDATVISSVACAGSERAMAKEVNYIAKILIQEAKKFMNRSKRNTLELSDVSNSLKSKGLHHYYHLMECNGNYSPIDAQNPASAMVDVEKLAESDNQTILDVNIVKPSIHAHWLCIDGVQPNINENPNFSDIERENETNNSTRKPANYNSLNYNMNLNDMAVESLNLLSFEQQLLFSQITELCIGPSESQRDLAISTLQTEPGFRDLLPHFVSFIVEGVRLNVNEANMVNLIYLMRMAMSLLTNRHLNTGYYVHDLLPAILTCTLTKTLLKKQDDCNHWFLRDYSAKLVAFVVCRNFDKFDRQSFHFHQLMQLIMDVLLVDDNSTQGHGSSAKYSWNARYGAVKILCEFGPSTLHSYLLPKLKSLSTKMQQEIKNINSQQQPVVDVLSSRALLKIQTLLLDNLGTISFWKHPSLVKYLTNFDAKSFEENFGQIGILIYNKLSATQQAEANMSNN